MTTNWFDIHLSNFARFEMQLYFKNLLNKAKIDNKKSIFEIGSGSNFIQQYFFETKFISSDILFTHSINIQLDCHFLPFKDKTFEQIIGIDILHHLRNPHYAINELARCLRDEGKIILIEPYISLFSFFIYKFFHHEYTSFKLRLKPKLDLLSDNPMEADNNIPTQIFTNKKNKIYLDNMLNFKYNLKVELIYSDFLSFFSTGGLQRNKSIIKGIIYKLLLNFENLIPQKILKLIGSRMIITIKKT